jgi:hypothetical protein
MSSNIDAFGRSVSTLLEIGAKQRRAGRLGCIEKVFLGRYEKDG